MDVSVALTLVQTLLQLLDSPIRREIESLWGYKSQLEKLKTTMSTINAMLLDAEQQQRQQLQLTHTQQDKLERLKEAVYQADDLFDEVATLAHHKKIMPGYDVTKEVRLFFSSFNQLRSAFTLSQEIENIREILDGIAKDHRDFGLTQPISIQVKSNSRETYSYICEKDVIVGRDEDKRIVMEMLVDTNSNQNVCFISIVGIGGLGKTTLAQLVYNDKRIVREFPLRMWVCVSDDFDVKALLGQILAAATNQSVQGGLNLDQLQMKLRQALDGKKYLLVLDDIWNEDCEEWRKLENLLIQGGKGSRIIVTTRSREVAKIIGSYNTHILQGLSEKDSWNLFERMTLEPGKHQMEAHLVDIGKEIVGKCANVPLALRVIGSLLRGEGEGQWEYMKNTDLANIKKDGINGIVPVLKISYFYLPVHLKSCFTYCAVFPKDYQIIKEDLIYLWMAQGFIVPLDGESLEDAGEEYFMNLLKRCFFQDVQRDRSGEIISCKMHDLIHDVAKEVAGIEMFSAGCFNEKTCHLFLDGSLKPENVGHCLTKMKRLRTILQPFKPYTRVSLNKLLLGARYLRVLDLRYTRSKELPSIIGELLHLKYLDLSYNEKLVVLPVSITKLYNLQTLKLGHCESLVELPNDLSNLVKLRHLDTYGCRSLTHMPQGMNYMTSLHKLTSFVFGGDGFGDLKYLNSIRDSMEIKVQEGWTYDAEEVREGGYLINKARLWNINICWYWDSYQGSYCREDKDREHGNNSEALLQGLQPHSNLKKLVLWHYPGLRFPNWAVASINLRSCLPKLVEVELNGCTRLENLPLMSQLSHLKILTLENLMKLEYVESNNIREGGSTASRRSRQVEADYDMVFFPSLENLVLRNLLNLKGWWKSSSHSDLKSGEGETKTGNGNHMFDNNNEWQEQKQFSTPGMHPFLFPRLCVLKIEYCPKLTTFPLCPELIMLELKRFNDALGPIMRRNTDGLHNPANGLYPDDESPSTSMSTSMVIYFRELLGNTRHKQDEEEDRRGRLRKVDIDNVEYLNSLPSESFRHLSELRIDGDHKLERLETVEVFRSGHLSSLCNLQFSECSRLKRLGGQEVWEHLTSLKTLYLDDFRELELDNEDKEVNRPGSSTKRDCTERFQERTRKEDIDGTDTDTDIPWRCIAPTLRSLTLKVLPKLVKLPNEMYHLTALQSLTITHCWYLEALPPWIACLSSLDTLRIRGCKSLKSLPEEMRHLTSLQQLYIGANSRELLNRCRNPTGADWPKIQHIPFIQ